MRAKQVASLVKPRSRPASGGPMKRELLNSMAFSARALGRSSLPLTNWLSSDCRSGVSKALSTPSSAAMVTISVGPIRPL
ncbi:hypothetical protein D9M69_631320 [compost metagenome]